MNTTIRILIDEDFTDPLAEQLLKLSGIDAVYVRHEDKLRGQKDDVIWQHAQEEERILVARDAGFSRTNYPVCTHHGIIRFKDVTYDKERLEAFKKFLLSGHRTQGKNAITYLSSRGCTFETHDGTIEQRY